ncbi:MAG TPA: 6-phospho-beta-glucosidase [Firmicutes bacterium]|nr:6-phospho-beta-glucosidase [Candidatus Fermentithermobacillaceae bacterium]
MKEFKLAVLGGGSSYAPELMDGIAKRYLGGEFHAREIVLVDVPEGRERMETVAAFTRRMFAKHGVPCEIRTTLDRREAFDGASFVISQIRVGGMLARQRDEHIPLKHGVIGQETTGAGGFANALRTIPVSLQFAREIEETCPDAWLLNFSNPAGLVTEALVRYARVKTFGLCNVPIGIKMGIAKALGVDPSRVSTDVSGLNHLSFVTGIWLDGRDITGEIFDSPLFDEYLRREKYGQEMGRFLRKLRVIPASYLYYYWCTERALKEQLAQLAEKGSRADEVMRIEKELFEIYANPESDVLPEVLKKRGGAYYSDVALSCISAIVNNKPAVEALNVVNRGAVPGISETSVVEVSCMVDGRGPHPLAQKPLPPEVLGLVQQVKAYENLTVEAAVTGDVEMAFFALLNHPLMPGADTVRLVLRDILEANRDHLPQFAGKPV